MSLQVIEFDDADLWAIYDSTHETMFAPVFENELAANIFAAWLYSVPALVANRPIRQGELAELVNNFVENFLDEIDRLPFDWAVELRKLLDIETVQEYGFEEFFDGLKYDLSGIEAVFIVDKLTAYIRHIDLGSPLLP